MGKMRALLWANASRRQFFILPFAHAIPTAGCDLGAAILDHFQLPNRSLLWGLHARPAKFQSDADIRSPTVARSFLLDFVHHFWLLNPSWHSCVPQIVILGALLESPTTLNTNAQKRRFGVEHLQIVFFSPSLEICISFGPCRTKCCFLICSIW